MNRAANDLPIRFAGTLVPLLMRVARMAGWAGIAAITILSLVPGSERPHTGLPGQAEHFAAYACTGFALSLAYHGLRERLIFWFVLATASGVFEILQIWIPGRDAKIQDALASTFGLTTGLVLGAMAAAGSPRWRVILFLRDAKALAVPLRNLYVVGRAVHIGPPFPSLCHFLEDCSERKDICISEQLVLSKPSNKFREHFR
jgi:hypothetical protein